MELEHKKEICDFCSLICKVRFFPYNDNVIDKFYYLNRYWLESNYTSFSSYNVFFVLVNKLELQLTKLMSSEPVF